jgi:glutamyl endopeptidase
MRDLANALPAPKVNPESIIGADQRVRVNPTTSFPARATAQILFKTSTSSSGSNLCTGWLISKNTIATAGHCVHPGTAGAAFYPRSTYSITPGRNAALKPYGSCAAIRLITNTNWVRGRGPEWDYAVIKLNCIIGNTVGWHGFFWQTASLTGIAEIIQGYPGDKPSGTHWRHGARIASTQVRRIFYQNDTFGGQSGSAIWYRRNSSCFVCSMGIHAYGSGNTGFNSGTRITKGVFNFLVRNRT